MTSTLTAQDFTDAATLKAHYAALRKRVKARNQMGRVCFIKRPQAPVALPVRDLLWVASPDPVSSASINDPFHAHKRLKQVADLLALSLDEMRSSSRTRYYVEARHIWICIVKTESDLSYNQLAKMINRDHTTVVHAITKFRAGDPRLVMLVNKMRMRLGIAI